MSKTAARGTGLANFQVHTSNRRWDRADRGVGGLSQTQAANMKIDGHLELSTNAIVLCACWVLCDNTLHISCSSHAAMQRIARQAVYEQQVMPAPTLAAELY